MCSLRHEQPLANLYLLLFSYSGTLFICCFSLLVLSLLYVYRCLCTQSYLNFLSLSVSQYLSCRFYSSFTGSGQITSGSIRFSFPPPVSSDPARALPSGGTNFPTKSPFTPAWGSLDMCSVDTLDFSTWHCMVPFCFDCVVLFVNSCSWGAKGFPTLLSVSS